MSEAVVCLDTHLERQVLIKALKPGTDPARILDELSALAAIRSKHVVQVYDVIKDDSGAVIAIVEELLTGSDLFSVPKPANFNEFLRCAFSISSGICDIHQHGVIHRDIKPNNMKFDGDGCLKIFDFGLARFAASNASTLSVIGTPGFMAPELAPLGASGAIPFTPAIDTFAFAATMLHIALGGLPKCMVTIPPQISSDVTFSALPYPVPVDLLALLDACFNPDPSQRPAVCAVRDRLQKHLLRDKHRALLVALGKSYVLDANTRTVNIGNNSLGRFVLRYDGLDFYVDYVAGDVFVNHKKISGTELLLGSCVVVVGAPELAAGRLSVSIDISHPEVVL